MEPKSISLRIGRIKRAFRADFEKRAETLDITKPQYHVLSRLWKDDGILTSVIAKDICVTGSTMTGVLDRMEAKGLIRRANSTTDRRAVEIWLTIEGRAMQKPLMKIIADINNKALNGFSEQQQERFLIALDKVGDNLDN
ncbi:MAG: MarR family winged helix-turn-helix transcriptional regulator [Abditibacteriaceae bacterium]